MQTVYNTLKKNEADSSLKGCNRYKRCGTFVRRGMADRELKQARATDRPWYIKSYFDLGTPWAKSY